MVEQQLKFDSVAMENLTKKDRYFSFVLKDLMKRNHNKEDALKIIFTSNVIGDSILEEQYQKELTA